MGQVGPRMRFGPLKLEKAWNDYEPLEEHYQASSKAHVHQKKMETHEYLGHEIVG